MTQQLVEEAKDRCTGRGRDPFNSFVSCEELTYAISEQRGEQNDGMRRKTRNLFEEVTHRKCSEDLECEPVLIGTEFLPSLRRTEASNGVVPATTTNCLVSGSELEGDVNRWRELPLQKDACKPRRQRSFAKLSCIDPAENNRYAGKNLIPVIHHEVQ